MLDKAFEVVFDADTVRRCLKFAQFWVFGSNHNLEATHPEVLVPEASGYLLLPF